MERERIVVGVDGSPSSVAALRLGLRFAVRSDADVEIITCWSPPCLADVSGVGAAYAAPEAFVAVARAQQEGTVAECEAQIATARLAGHRVTERILEGDPARTLVSEAKGAAMVVVGRHGHRPIARRLLGSVTLYVADHATCPVLVVPEDAD